MVLRISISDIPSSRQKAAQVFIISKQGKQHFKLFVSLRLHNRYKTSGLQSKEHHPLLN